MRHQVHGKKLNRSSGHRRALYRNLVQSLVEHERITTTLVKAKAVRPVFEQLVTRAGKQDLAARRAVIAYLPTKSAADKMYEVLGPRFVDRPGGYTRIIKLGNRKGDNTPMAMIELVEISAPATKKSATKSTKKATKDTKPSTSEKQADQEVAQDQASTAQAKTPAKAKTAKTEDQDTKAKSTTKTATKPKGQTKE